MRELGGLYVLGTERHESRRIDNQLRGRAGRQGDPGESRFYLSLEDDLMRLFATGAMSWVMDRAFPDDMPLEAKMVTKAIERAQRTVEDRNFEIRKDVLKYDEVMNEQRKVIYRRRQQILDGEDLARADDGGDRGRGRPPDRPRTARASSPRTGTSTSSTRTCSIALPDRRSPRERLDDAMHVDQLARRSCVADALEHYEAKEQAIGAETLREIERRVMLSVIDQHWREHLYEMDYLREGINLRAMGQRDPLAEWQREGYDMFEAMMGGIEDDFVQLRQPPPGRRRREPQPRAARPALQRRRGPGAGARRRCATAAASVASRGGARATAGSPTTVEPTARGRRRVDEPVRVDKQPGRNEPCYCGSGKKFKLCHGR